MSTVIPIPTHCAIQTENPRDPYMWYAGTFEQVWKRLVEQFPEATGHALRKYGIRVVPFRERYERVEQWVERPVWESPVIRRGGRHDVARV